MKIETVGARRFTYTTAMARDSDGHPYPLHEREAIGACLTITTGSGDEGHLIAAPSDIREDLLDRFVRPGWPGPIRCASASSGRRPTRRSAAAGIS